ncbi:MAG: Gfo/Idh/MocA family oxidoreductase, partial [Bacteroidota bacterium]
MPTPIHFAVIGLGHIGRRHAALVAAHRATELVALVDVLPEEELSRPDGVGEEVPLFGQVDELLRADLQVDVVCICTPNGLHAEQA